METTYSPYKISESIARIDNILSEADSSYTDNKGIPSRENLTFNNGYYVDVTVIFIDMRDSKLLTENHTRPVIAKIYRAYISEIIAIMRDNQTINEIYIEGDGIWAVFNTTTKTDVQSVFSTAAKASSLINILNKKLSKKNYQQIKVGIGIDDGTSLYIKAGYKGSGVNEVVWIGKVVGNAAQLCKNGNRLPYDKTLNISETVYKNLSDHQKALLSWSPTRNCYHGNVINTEMEKSAV